MSTSDGAKVEGNVPRCGRSTGERCQQRKRRRRLRLDAPSTATNSCVFRRKRSVSPEFSITPGSEAAERPTRGLGSPPDDHLLSMYCG